MVLSDGAVLVMGGVSFSGLSNEVWKSVDGGVKWIRVASDAWATGGED